jgi:putative membrane protein
MLTGFLAVVLLAAPQVALAHPGGALPTASWYHDKVVVVLVVVAGWAYYNGVAARRALYAQLPGWPRVAFFGGLLVLSGALLSPLDTLGGTRVTARMAQHIVLVGVAAPLLVLGKPLLPLLTALPPRPRRIALTCWHHITRVSGNLPRPAMPLAAFVLHALALVLWHTPFFYTLASHNAAMHWLELASLLATALLFWWSLRARTNQIDRAPFVLPIRFWAIVLCTLTIAGLLALAPTRWYPASVANGVIWAVLHQPNAPNTLFVCNSAAANQLIAALLRDQQSAGLVMGLSAPAMLGFALLYRRRPGARLLRDAHDATTASPPPAA